MATVALQRAVADLPAMRARLGGGDTDPPGPGTLRQPRGDRRNSPARPCTPAPCAQRGTPRSACAKFYRPSKVLQNRQPAAKNHRPPRDKFYPTDTPTPWGSATTPFARMSAFPRRAGEPRRPQHMRALCFPCSRALPTCRAGGTPAAAQTPRKAAAETCWRRARAHVAGAGSDLHSRCVAGAVRTPSPPAAPSPRRQRRAPRRWQGAGRSGEGPTRRHPCDRQHVSRQPTAARFPLSGRVQTPGPSANTNDNY